MRSKKKNDGDKMIFDKVYFIGTGRVGSDCLKVIVDACGPEKVECLAVEQETVPIMYQQSKRLGVSYKAFDSKSLRKYLLSFERNNLLISAHNQYIFTEDVVTKENLKIINFHNAYLPEYRGRNAPTWEIFNGESYGGATWHLVAAGVDTGNIIVQEKVAIEQSDTALSLLMKCARVGVRLLRENIGAFLNDSYETILPQKIGRLYYSKELPNGGWLPVNSSFKEIKRFLLAMDYHGMPIVPLPRVKINDVTYIVDSYEFCKKPCMVCNTALFISDNGGKEYINCSLQKECLLL